MINARYEVHLGLTHIPNICPLKTLSPFYHKKYHPTFHVHLAIRLKSHAERISVLVMDSSRHSAPVRTTKDHALASDTLTQTTVPHAGAPATTALLSSSLLRRGPTAAGLCTGTGGWSKTPLQSCHHGNQLTAVFCFGQFVIVAGLSPW